LAVAPHEDSEETPMPGMMTRTSTRPRRILRTVLWLGPLALFWAVLIVLAHRPTPGAISRTRSLFNLSIPLSYLLIWGWVIGIGPRPRRMLIRGIATTLTLAGLLICLEVPAALGYVSWSLIFSRMAGEENPYGNNYIYDPDLGFRHRPQVQWAGRPPSDIEAQFTAHPSLREAIRFTYDRGGYRNPTDLERADVVLIGDSFVEGWYVSDEQVAARRLQARLGRPVANLGVAGYGAMQEFRMLKQDGMRLGPSVVVWFFYEGNDLYEDASFEYTLAALPALKGTFSQRGGWRKRSFTTAALRLLRGWSDPVLPNLMPYQGSLSVAGGGHDVVYFSDYYDVPWTAYEEECWARSRAALKQGVDFCRQKGIHLLLCYIPLKFRVYRPFVTFPPGDPCLKWEIWSRLPRYFADFCRSADVPCLDLTGPLQDAVRQGRMPYARMDTHWSPDGHTLVAERLADEFRRRGWLSAAEADSRDR
jgi:hypothetical protein